MHDPMNAEPRQSDFADLEARLDALAISEAAAVPPQAFVAAVRRRRHTRIALRTAPLAILLAVGAGVWFNSAPSAQTAPSPVREYAEAPAPETTGFPTLAALTRLNADCDLDRIILPAPVYRTAIAPPSRSGRGPFPSISDTAGF